MTRQEKSALLEPVGRQKSGDKRPSQTLSDAAICLILFPHYHRGIARLGTARSPLPRHDLRGVRYAEGNRLRGQGGHKGGPIFSMEIDRQPRAADHSRSVESGRVPSAGFNNLRLLAVCLLLGRTLLQFVQSLAPRSEPESGIKVVLGGGGHMRRKEIASSGGFGQTPAASQMKSPEEVVRGGSLIEIDGKTEREEDMGEDRGMNRVTPASA